MLIKEKIRIEALTGDRERWMYIYLPIDFNSDERYPVLYMFDGHNVFYDEDATYGKSWGMKRYMDLSGTPVIIVAIECNHVGSGRLHEYSPFPCRDRKYGEFHGLGPVYMDWLVNELKPEIDASLPTLADRSHTFIAGSSMGGLMTLFALTKYNHIFSRGAALSPSLWVDTKQVMEMVNTAEIAPDTWLYMDYGSEELSSRSKKKMLSIFKRVGNALMDQGAFVCSRIIPGGDHSEASWERQLPIFMRCLGLTEDFTDISDYDAHWDDADEDELSENTTED